MNEHTQELIRELKKTAIEQKAPVWKRVAEDLEKSARNRRIVNLFTIERNAQDGKVIVVPGKVLAEGDLTKKVTVAALSFSSEAKRKIEANGKTLTLRDALKTKPSEVVLLG